MPCSAAQLIQAVKQCREVELGAALVQHGQLALTAGIAKAAALARYSRKISAAVVGVRTFLCACVIKSSMRFEMILLHTELVFTEDLCS